MRISELADATGVSIASLKYYLREGLLHPGESSGATRADYDDSHVDRVRLVRALIDIGRLSIDRVREVVWALNDPPSSRHDLLGTAHSVLRPPDDRAVAGSASAQVRALVDALGWQIQPESAARHQVGSALGRAAAAGWHVEVPVLQAWAGAARQVAETDVTDALGSQAPQVALRYAILGNVLTDPILLALRRLAQEAVSAAKFGPRASA